MRLNIEQIDFRYRGKKTQKYRNITEENPSRTGNAPVSVRLHVRSFLARRGQRARRKITQIFTAPLFASHFRFCYFHCPPSEKNIAVRRV